MSLHVGRTVGEFCNNHGGENCLSDGSYKLRAVLPRDLRLIAVACGLNKKECSFGLRRSTLSSSMNWLVFIFCVL